MIKTPAVFLSFDDWHIREWHTLMPLFEAYAVRATFYLAFSYGDWKYEITDKDWDRLQEIKDAGHTIGYHSWNHLNAGKVTRNLGCKSYLEKEIYPGLEVLSGKGYRPRHFAYPYGDCSQETHRCLLKHFDTLRVATASQDATFYTVNELQARVFSSVCIEEKEVNSWLRLLTRDGKVGFVFGHSASSTWALKVLTNLLKLGRDLSINFYSMDKLNIERR